MDVDVDELATVRVAVTGRDAIEPADEAAGLPAGGTLGRYVVLEEVGAGGMGRVYRAYDPRLDREVALKLLKVRGRNDAERERAEARIAREAQAMAQLSHPNVLPVFDVAKVGTSMFLVMEFVEGRTLRSWLKRSRPLDEVVAAFVEAGRGLAAAHAAGIVHRDFKPNNVLVGSDGRVRVMDFGVARGERGSQASVRGSEHDSFIGEEPRLDSNSSDSIGVDGPLTEAGMVMGTPAYMAPEHQCGEPVGPASDQYSFCVSLYEALYGHRPFPNGSWRAMLDAKRRGILPPPRRDPAVPRHLLAILHRGLAPDPAQRFASMDELLRALSDDPRARRNRVALLGAATTSIVALGAVASLSVERDETCAGGRALVESQWNPQTRERIAAAMNGTSVAYASDTWVRIEHELDRYAEHWVASRRDACEATHVREEQSASDLDLRVACYDRARASFGAVIEILTGELTPTVVVRAVESVLALPNLDRCADLVLLKQRVPPPDDPDIARRVDDEQRELVRAEAMLSSGRFSDGLVLARAVQAEGRRLAYPALEARASFVIGRLQQELGDYLAAEESLQAAYLQATATGDDATAAEVAAVMVPLLGFDRGKVDEAERWNESAWAWVHRLGPGGELEASVAAGSGVLAREIGDFEASVQHSQRVLEIQQRLRGDADHPALARALSNLATSLLMVHRIDEALGHQQRATAMFERLFGPEHPRTADAISTMAALLQSKGDRDGARSAYERALRVRLRALGPEHPDVGAAHNNLGSMLLERGELELAVTHLRAALDNFQRSLEHDHPNLAFAHANLGAAMSRLGRYDEARPHLLRALAIRETALGSDHPAVARVLIDLGTLDYRLRRDAPAEQFLRRSIAILEQRFGTDFAGLVPAYASLCSVLLESPGRLDEAHRLASEALRLLDLEGDHTGPKRAQVERLRGEALQRAGRHDEARPHLERAIVVLGDAVESRESRAEVHMLLAESLIRSREAGDRARARDLARQARDVYAELHRDAARQHVDGWLAAHASAR